MNLAMGGAVHVGLAPRGGPMAGRAEPGGERRVPGPGDMS
jgi:hypothetical protein